MKLHSAIASLALLAAATTGTAALPHIVLVMADDMGWGQTGYYGHPVLETPNLDAMAANGLRFDRFYAGAPVCSPTRASVLTGRSNDRTGVEQHGFPLRLQEKPLPSALRQAGYRTGHFGKWHLNGLRGPGVPVLGDDSHSPGAFGFETWLTTTNFFDVDPLLSRGGPIESFTGDSSEVIVDEALKFLSANHSESPTFTVIWYGSPHSPFVASDADRAAFSELSENSANHYGELVAMDRSIGTLRAGLRELGIADDTLLWFCSDNGGLKGITPESVGGLRGNKGTLYEGGLRVPAVIEWPAVIRAPRATEFPAVTMDIFPTITAITGLPESSMLAPVDGIDLSPLFEKEIGPRPQPVPFRYMGGAALIDGNLKLILQKSGKAALYDLEADPAESRDLATTRKTEFDRMRAGLDSWLASVEASVAGSDYPGGSVDSPQPERQFWKDDPRYAPYLDGWSSRPEYQKFLSGKR